MKYKEIKSLIIDWANAKELIKKENAGKQYLKFLEEVGETANAILKQDIDKVIDGFGDIAVTMIILGEQIGNTQELSDINKPLTNITLYDVVRRVSPEFVNPSAMNFLHDCAWNHGCDLNDCIYSAWLEIKDRKGKTINGTFIKETNEQ
jgi:hypothetical protein